jgi:hypothetical protein
MRYSGLAAYLCDDNAFNRRPRYYQRQPVFLAQAAKADTFSASTVVLDIAGIVDSILLISYNQDDAYQE